MLEQCLGIVWLIGVTCLLPILVVFFLVRKKINDTNKRTEIIMSALEKNPGIDVEEWLGKLAPKQRMIKEKLLAKLVWAIIVLLVGTIVIAFGIYLRCNHLVGSSDPAVSFVMGGVILAVGIALLVYYFLGKKYLAKEIEAEEREKVLGNQQ